MSNYSDPYIRALGSRVKGLRRLEHSLVLGFFGSLDLLKPGLKSPGLGFRV